MSGQTEEKMRNAARIATRVALVASILALVGCAAVQDFFTARSKRNAPVKLVSFKQTMNVGTAWKASVGSAGLYTFSPSLSDGNLYAAAADGTIMRLDAATGKVQWRIKAGVPLTAGVGSNINTVAVVGEKGKVLTFDSAGKPRWQAQAPSEVISPPAVTQGLVIIHSVDNQITAFDIESGERRWVQQETVPPLTLRVASGITPSDTLAYVTMPAGKLLAVSLANGAPVWESTVSEPRGSTELERLSDTTGFPVLAGSDVCAVTYQGHVSCFDAAGGTPRWSKPLSSTVGLGVDERFIFTADEHGTVSAFSRDLGAGMWSNDKLKDRRLSTPASFGRAVAVGDFEGYVHFLSREDGAFLARVSTDGSAVIGMPVIAGDNLIVQTHSGSVVALSIK